MLRDHGQKGPRLERLEKGTPPLPANILVKPHPPPKPFHDSLQPSHGVVPRKGDIGAHRDRRGDRPVSKRNRKKVRDNPG